MNPEQQHMDEINASNSTFIPWNEITLPPMGHVVESRIIQGGSRQIKIKPINGPEFFVSVYRVVDKILRGEIDNAVKQETSMYIPVLWGEYKEQPVAVVGQRNSMEINGWAKNCEKWGNKEAAIALYQLIVDNYPEHSKGIAARLERMKKSLPQEDVSIKNMQVQSSAEDTEGKESQPVVQATRSNLKIGDERQPVVHATGLPTAGIAWQQQLLDTKGNITGLTGEYIIVTRNEGGSFLVQRTIEMDDALRKALDEWNGEVIPVMWMEYNGSVVVITSQLDSQHLYGLAMQYTVKKNLRVARALHQMVLDRYPNAFLQSQAVALIDTMLEEDNTTAIASSGNAKSEKDPVSNEEKQQKPVMVEPAQQQVVPTNNTKLESTTLTNKAAEEKQPWHKRPFTPMGRIISVTDTQITVKPWLGQAFVAPISAVVEKVLENKLHVLADEGNGTSKIPVAWSVYKGAVKCLWEKMTPEQLSSRANSLSEDKDYEGAYSILDLLASKNSFYGKQLERVIEKMKGTGDGAHSGATPVNLYEVPQPVEKQSDIKAVLPPMGYITKLAETKVTVTSVVGAIFDVPKTLILDKEVNKKINALNAQKSVEANIPVLWGIGGEKLVCLVGLMTAEQLNSRAITYSDGGNYIVAIALLEMLVARCDNENYVRRLVAIKDKEKESGSGTTKDEGALDSDQYTGKEDAYTKAMSFYKKGMYEEAVPYYQQAIDESLHRAEAVHAIITCYTKKEGQQLDAAAEVVRKYILNEHDNQFVKSGKLFKAISTWTFQHSYYKECMELNKMRLDFLGDNIINARKDGIYATIAKCYVNMERPDDAEAYYKKAIENTDDFKKKKEYNDEINQLNGTFEMSGNVVMDSLEPSLYTNFLMDTCVSRLPANMPHTKDELEKMKKERFEIQDTRYGELSRLYLYLAGMESEVYPENNDNKCEFISRHIYYSALEMYKNEVIGKDELRFLVCESAAAMSSVRYQRRSGYIVNRCVETFLQSFNENSAYVFIKADINKILEIRQLFEMDNFFEHIAEIMQYRLPFSIMTRKFFESNYQVPAIEFLERKGYSVSAEGSNAGFEGFKKAWNQYIMDFREKQKGLGTIMNYMRQSNTFDELTERYNEFCDKISDYESSMCADDYVRVKQVSELLEGNAKSYFKSSVSSFKDNRYLDAMRDIDPLIELYVVAPTRFSYSLVLLMRRLKKMMEDDYKATLEKTRPYITLNTICNCQLDKAERVAEFDIEVKNKLGCSAVKNYAISIATDTNVLEYISGGATVFNSLEGGAGTEIRQKIRLSDEAIIEGAIEINVSFSYEAPGFSNQQMIQCKLSLQLESEFQEIENKYQPYAEGATPKQDMFFGRKEDIMKYANSLTDTEQVKQIFIYGQRRSGKTTFRDFLAVELAKRMPRPFCVSFSFESVENNKMDGSSSFFFFYIMLQIVRALASEGVGSLDFRYLGQTEKDKREAVIRERYYDTLSPADLFVEDMSELHAALDKEPEWCGRKIILLIDEFTNVYGLIKKGRLPKTIMKQWKAVTQDKNVKISAVFIGQDTTPQFVSEDSNAFAITELVRLGYLKPDEAHNMIVKPLLDEQKHSRFVGAAEQRIKDLTACNPYYLMMFMDKLVSYMNSHKIGKVTETDVDNTLNLYLDEVAGTFKDAFHSLFSAVDGDDDKELRNTWEVLRIIALVMEAGEEVSEEMLVERASKLEAPLTHEQVTDIVRDLIKREVVDKFTLKIKVLMFQKGLLRSPMERLNEVSMKNNIRQKAPDEGGLSLSLENNCFEYSKIAVSSDEAMNMMDALIHAGTVVTGDRFVGRKEVLNKIVRLFYRSEVGKNYAVYGLPRIGKTSLFKNAYEIYKKQDGFKSKHICVFIDLSCQLTVGGVYHAIMESVANASSEHISEDCMQEMKSYMSNIETAVDGDNAVSKFMNFIDICRREGLFVRAVLDEFDNILKICRKDDVIDSVRLVSFFGTLRTEASSNDGVFRIAIVSRNRIAEIEPGNDISKLSGICGQIHLEPFSSSEMQEYWSRLERVAPAIISERHKSFVEEYAGSIPYWLDIVNAAIVNNMDDGESLQREIRTVIIQEYESVMGMLANSSNLTSSGSLDSKLMQVMVGPRMDLNEYDVLRLRNYGVVSIAWDADGNGRYISLSPRFNQYLKYKPVDNPRDALMVLEKRMRRLLKECFLPDRYGAEWEKEYGERVLKGRMDTLRNDRRTAENLFGDKASRHLVDYFYMSYYPDVISSDWEWFREVFKKFDDDKDLLLKRMRYLAKVRNPLAHANEHYLSDEDRSNVNLFSRELVGQIEEFMARRK